MNDREYQDWPRPTLWGWLFWGIVAVMCLCTLIVVGGGIGYLAGIFN